jgi:hypothetical protein
LELFIGRKVTGLDWRFDSLWSVAFTPTMQSMGHSSPNNVNPSTHEQKIKAGSAFFMFPSTMPSPN